MRGNELISQIGRVVAENEVLKRRCQELTAENAQLRHLLREQGKQMDQKSWDEWLEATTQAAARRAQR